MNEVYIEQIVKYVPPKSAAVVKALLCVMCVVSLVLWILPYFLGVLVTAALIAFTVYKSRSYDCEYEYAYLNGELDVDKIVCRTSRKKCASFDFRKLEVITTLGSQKDLGLSHNNYKVYDYSSGATEEKKYVAYTMMNNEKVRLVFEPNQELLDEILRMSRLKVE